MLFSFVVKGNVVLFVVTCAVNVHGICCDMNSHTSNVHDNRDVNLDSDCNDIDDIKKGHNERGSGNNGDSERNANGENEDNKNRAIDINVEKEPSTVMEKLMSTVTVNTTEMVTQNKQCVSKKKNK